MERSTARTRALDELRHLDSIAEPRDRPVKQQCNHFSIREYVAVLKKKDPKLYSLSQNFCKQQHQDEHQNLRPIPVTKFRRWNCSSCLDKLVNCEDRTTSPKHSGTNSGCSISFVRSVIPTSVQHTRLLTCTQRSSQGNEGVGSALPKSIQERNSPSGSKGALTVMNDDPATKESQELPNNLNVMESMSNNASMDVSVLSEIPRIISSTAGNCTKGLKFRKRKRMRRLSELIETDLSGALTNSVDVHASTNDLCESDKGKNLLEVEKDTGTAVSNERVEEIQSITVQNKTKRRIDDVDDQSSLMNWLNRIPKKVRTKKTDSEHRNVDSSAVSSSTPVIPASEKLHHDFEPSAGDQSQKDDPAIINSKHGNKNMKNNCQGPNVSQTHDLCQDAPSNSKQRPFLSKGKFTILLKGKVPATNNAKHGGIKSGSPIVKKNRLNEDDKGQMAPENSQRHLTKVSHVKCGSHNVSGTSDQKMATNKKKQKLQMIDKQTDEIDEIPMDVVESLARHQHKRQLMNDADSLETTHSRPKIAQEDCDQIAAKDGSIDASTDLDTNFQESLTSLREQKILSHASSSTEVSNMHLLEGLDMQMSVQGQAVPRTEAAEEQMQNSMPVHAASITDTFQVYPPKLRIPDILMCAEEQQAHSHMDREVTIACVSPTFPHHQNVADVPTWSLGTNGANKLMWDSFKTATRNPSMSSYGAQSRSGFRDGGSPSTHVFGASNNYPTYPPPLEHYTKKAVNQVLLRNQAMDAGGLYNQRIAGQSGLYPRERHLLRLMDSSTVSGFTNRSRVEFEASGSSQYMQNLYKASLGTSYVSHPIEKFPLTQEDLSRHPAQQNFHRPIRPLPRVGVLGSLLQQDIAKWSEHRGAHNGYRPGPGVSQGIVPFDANRQENCDVLNTETVSANALQLGSAISAASPDYSSPRYCEEQPWSRGRGKVVHPLDKLVRRDICQTNRNPADFNMISDKNEYMITL